MKAKTRFITALICLITSFGFAQVKQQQINPTYLSIADGLASPDVKEVLQDSYGLLWIGTSNGLQKYDGYRFETFKHVPNNPYSLLTNGIWGLAEDANQDIWVATDEGVSKYDRKKNEFINYAFVELFDLPPDVGRVFTVFIDSQQRIWAATQAMELVKYNPETDSWGFAEYDIPNITDPDHNGFSIAITEDAQGGIWFGSTLYGLMHMSKDEKTFKPVKADNLEGFDFVNPNNDISSIYSDTNNILWLTTRKGIYKFNPKTNNLKTLVDYSDSETRLYDRLNKILPDQQGNIWITNNFKGILKFDGITDNYQEITIAGKLKMNGAMWDITMSHLIVDRSGIFWFGSLESGLLKYDPINKPFSYFSHIEEDPLSISPNGVFGILASTVKPGTMYVGSRGEGLNIFDPKKRSFEKVAFDVVDDYFGGSVRSIAEDPDGTLWLGTWGDGLIELDKNYREINRYKYEADNTNTLSNTQVRVIRADGRGKLWVGTNNGVNIFDPATGNFQRLMSKFTLAYPQNLVKEFDTLSRSDQSMGLIDKVKDSEDRSQAIEINEEDTYFIMSVGEGDSRSMADYGWIENAQNDTIWKFNNFEESYYAGGAAKNRIVMAPITLQPGSYTLRFKADNSHAYDAWNEDPPDQTSLYGLSLIKPLNDKQSASFEQRIAENKKGIVMGGNNISDIEIGTKYIWVSANGQGLNRIDPETNEVTYYDFDPKKENSLSSTSISDILEDSKGIIWLATSEGINKLDPYTGIFTQFTEIDGLPTNLTEVILEGDNGEMWIGTQNGISQMVTNESLGKVTFINYNTTDGLGGDIFIPLGAARSTDGTFYFGGDHGLTSFKSITANNTPPDLLISNVLISNKSVLDMGSESPLTTSLLNTDVLNLSHQQNNLSFEFSALHFANPEKNQYAHKLIGYDEDWIYDNRNFASYTNLYPGEYQFAIRASNAYGIWNEEGKILNINIAAPWWQRWWAYALYAVVVLLGFIMVNRFMRAKIKRKEQERSREKELAHAKEIAKAYNKLKNTQSQLIQSEKMASLGELTAGIAHEIQNPLNFVNNFSEVSNELIDEMNEELDKGDLEEAKAISLDIKQNLEKIYHHGKRADNIVKGMLQHSRSSSGTKEPTDINALADEYLRLAYHGLRAKDKSFNAELVTDFDEHIGKVNIIPQDMGRVILNLITNAFYAVNEKKQKDNNFKPIVAVSTKKTGDHLEIKVTDNGDGIPDKVKEKIFQPFFTTKPTGQGTGLGLSMSYDIIKAHDGEIHVESENHIGTTFWITLPV